MKYSLEGPSEWIRGSQLVQLQGCMQVQVHARQGQNIFWRDDPRESSKKYIAITTTIHRCYCTSDHLPIAYSPFSIQ